MYNYTALDQTKIEYVEIAPASELPNGERLFVEVAGKAIVIFNIAGQLFCIGDVCTHDGGPLAEGVIEGMCVICPRHGAKFNLKTGKPTFPAVERTPIYPVEIDGADVKILIE